MNTLATLNSVAQNAEYFQTEMYKALQEMAAIARSQELKSKEFADAKARFDLARLRCQKEMERLEV